MVVATQVRKIGTSMRISEFTVRCLIVDLLMLPICSAALGDCLSCPYSSDVPKYLWADFEKSVKRFDAFALADEQLAMRFMQITNSTHASPIETIFDAYSLQKYSYPWKAERFDVVWDGSDDGEVESSFAEFEAEHAHESLRMTYRQEELGYEDCGKEGGCTPKLTNVIERDDAEAPFFATKSHKDGKWYWEVEYVSRWAALSRPGTIGVLDVRRLSRDAYFSGESIDLPANLAASLRGGEHVQFALDLENNVLHVGVNGSWGSDPQHPDTGRRLHRGAFVPALMPADSDHYPYRPDRYVFNFGEHRFRYRPPNGFLS